MNLGLIKTCKMETKKTIVKRSRKILGYVYIQNKAFWYVFGKPSQPYVISFSCKSLEDGINSIKTNTY